MNVYLRELKTYRKSTIIWALSLSAIVVMFMTIYPSFTKDVAASKQALSGLPIAIRKALDLSLANFFTIFGFYSYLLNFVTLAGAIQAMNLGTGIISKEDTGKTADFLLSKPVTRGAVVTSKLLAALSVLVFTNAVFIGVSLATAEIVSKTPFNTKTLLLLSLILFLIQLAFLALGTFFRVEGGQQWGFQLVSRKRSTGTCGDAIHLAAGDMDHCAIRIVIRQRPGFDLNARSGVAVRAHLAVRL